MSKGKSYCENCGHSLEEHKEDGCEHYNKIVATAAFAATAAAAVVVAVVAAFAAAAVVTAEHCDCIENRHVHRFKVIKKCDCGEEK